ncbi:MAG TPA: hypothetical protein VM553_16040 [Dongiaceae bacterium]|nr:hypothetical protein [Dongiaceae bacterium]
MSTPRTGAPLGQYLTDIPVLLVPLVLLFLCTLQFTDGHFTYTLDDPYIHLALAKNIWLGHYGINPTEASAPSSSILWPFLLVPAAALGNWFEYVPLLYNCVFLVLTGLVLLATFSHLGKLRSLTLTLVLLLSLNCYGLVFNGLEHSLQILLVAFITYAMLNPELIRQRAHLSNLFYASLVLLPLVRYEGLAISVPVLAYCFAQGEKKQAEISTVFLLLLLGSFSFFLNQKQLGLLPSSVVAKLSDGSSPSVWKNLLRNLTFYGLILIPVGLICRKLYGTNRSFVLMLASVTLLHFLFGKFGWFGRYEVYYVIFVMIIGLHLLTQHNHKRWRVVWLLPILFITLLFCTLYVPRAAANIHYQHGQMAEIAKQLDGSVAVNDLGMVTLRSGRYVLDLWGLGSIEALNSRLNSSDEDARWIDRLMTSRNVHYAMIYEGWIKARPANWIKVGELKLMQKRITPAFDTVSFYADTEAAAEKFRAILQQHARRGSSDTFRVDVP